MIYYICTLVLCVSAYLGGFLLGKTRRTLKKQTKIKTHCQIQNNNEKFINFDGSEQA